MKEVIYISDLKELCKKLKGMDLSKYVPEVLEPRKMSLLLMNPLFSKRDRELIRMRDKIEEILKKEESK